MPDEAERIPTLTGPQEAALAALVAGATITEAAVTAQVTRPTVSTWVNHDVAFRAALRNARADVWAGLRRKLEWTGVRAVDALAGALDDADARVRIAAAAKLLALLGGELSTPPPPAAEDDEHLTALARSIELRMREAPAEYDLPRDADEGGAP